MTHPTEEALALYAFDPDAAPDRREIETHVSECPQCHSSLTFIRSVDGGMADEETWDIAEREESASRFLMRQLASQVAEESEDAKELLADLQANPGVIAWTDLGTHRKYQTAGVVRHLIGIANEACERDPLEALTFADAAVDIADRLTKYEEKVLHDLRGTAWKERANALRLLGRYDAALDALTHAEREFRLVPEAPLGPAMVKFVRGIVYYERGELDRAAIAAEESAKSFSGLGETDRYMRARHLQANILFNQQDIRAARAIYEDLLAWGEVEDNLAWIARENNTLGRCAHELGDLSASVQHYHRAVQAFRQLGLHVGAARSEWGLALVVHASGKPSDAFARLGDLRRDFHQREMLIDEALVSLDMMDALLSLGRSREIVNLAAEIIQTFTNAGMLTSALTAFAYLKEAARKSNITPPKIAHVRNFIRQLEREPSLLFEELR